MAEPTPRLARSLGVSEVAFEAISVDGVIKCGGIERMLLELMKIDLTGMLENLERRILGHTQIDSPLR